MPAPDVALGDRHDEPQVRLGELPLGELAVALTACRLERWFSLIVERLAVGVDAELLGARAAPASMRLASVTSCSAVSSGTLPISLRYMRTGSKLPPSACVGRGADAHGASPDRVRRRTGARAAAPGRGAALGRCSVRRRRGGGAGRRPAAPPTRARPRA